MTAKDKVLKVWPDSHVYINKILHKWMWYRDSDPDAVSPMFETEEAAWQNAAESLLAQPEHPRADCEGCNKPDCPCNTGEGGEGWMGMFSNNAPEPVAPVEAKEKEQRAANIPCYEVYDAKDIDCTVFQHERMKDLQEFVYQLLDGLEDGESIRIEFKNYTKEELDEVYDEL